MEIKQIIRDTRIKCILIIAFFLNISISFSQWERIGNGLPNKTDFLNFLVVDSSLFAATNKGIFVSTNGGLDWFDRNIGIDNQYKFIKSFIIQVDSVLICGFTTQVYPMSKLYKSTNNGLEWRRITSCDTIRILSISANESTVYISSDLIENKVICSKDLGETWNIFNTQFLSGYISKFIVNGSYIIANTKNSIFFSSDEGINWGIIVPYTSTIMNNSLCSHKGELAFCSDSNGVIKSTDNTSNWFNSKLIVDNRTKIPMTLISNGDYLFCGYEVGIMISMDDGVSWKIINMAGELYSVISLAFQGEYLFFGSGDFLNFRGKLSDILASVDVDEKPINRSKSSLIISPNPTSNQIKIRIGDDLGRFSTGKVEISSNIGEMLTNIPIYEGIHSQGIDLDVSAYPSGMYFCTVRSGSYVETQPFLVIH